MHGAWDAWGVHGVRSPSRVKWIPFYTSKNCRILSVFRWSRIAEALQILLSRQFDYTPDYVPRDVKWEPLLWRKQHFSAYCRHGNIYFRWQTLHLILPVVYHLRSMLGSDFDGRSLAFYHAYRFFFRRLRIERKDFIEKRIFGGRVSEYFIFTSSRCEINFFADWSPIRRSKKRKIFSAGRRRES